MRAFRYILLSLVLILVMHGAAKRLGHLINAPRPIKEVERGARLLARGNQPLALKAFDRAVAGSSDQDVYLAVIGLLIQEGMYRESKPYIRRAIALPDENGGSRIVDSELYTMLGDASWKLGDLPQAEKAYQEAIRLNKDNATAYNNWGYMLAESNQQLDKALELTSKAVALEPGNWCFLDSIGWVYFQKGDPARAVGYLRKAAELSPSEIEIRLHYAMAVDAAGDRKAALVEYNKVLRLSPSNITAKERIRTFHPKNTSK